MESWGLVSAEIFFNMHVNLWLKPLIFSFPSIFRLPNSLSSIVGVLSSMNFSRNMRLNAPQFCMDFSGRLWYHAAARPSKVHETIYMLGHHTVPQGSTTVGRSFPSGLLPSPWYQGWTWCSFSLLASTPCAEQTRELVDPESSIPSLGQPSLLLPHPLPLFQIWWFQIWVCWFISTSASSASFPSHSSINHLVDAVTRTPSHLLVTLWLVTPHLPGLNMRFCIINFTLSVPSLASSRKK